jgi:hypothetical protein
MGEDKEALIAIAKAVYILVFIVFEVGLLTGRWSTHK